LITGDFDESREEYEDENGDKVFKSASGPLDLLIKTGDDSKPPNLVETV
jgi:hypothetical protein